MRVNDLAKSLADGSGTRSLLSIPGIRGSAKPSDDEMSGEQQTPGQDSFTPRSTRTQSQSTDRRPYSIMAKPHLRATSLRRCQALAAQLSRRPYSSSSSSTMKIIDYDAPHTGKIRVLLMDQPANRNALSRQFCKDFGEQIEVVKSQQSAKMSKESIRALILASNLDNAFCAGADLKERKGMSPEETKEFLTGVRKSCTDLENLPIPTISAISSYALGGGLELALCTTLRVFATTAVVGLPETRLAIFPGAGGTYRLPRVIGLDKARDLILTGRRLTGAQAYALGLCNRLVSISDEEANMEAVARTNVLEEAIDLAKQICEGGPIGVQQALVAVNAWEKGEEGMLAPYKIVTETEDRNEALKAFGEKRKPAYQGR
jgi:methylglutaconyl-CoA hydratase